MTAKEKKVRQENKSTASAYFKKATSNWNAAATLAVQCAISSADAICVYEKGVRSISSDHLDSCDLVKQLPIKDAVEKAKQLKSSFRLILVLYLTILEIEWLIQ